MPPTVVTALGSPADSQIERDILQAVDANFVHIASLDAPADREIIRQADALMVTIHPVTAELIASMERCKIISRAGTGLDAIDIPAATAHGVWVAYVPDYSVDEVSSHAIGLLLSHARAIPQLLDTVRAGKWSNQAAVPRRRLRGQTLGLLGFGHIFVDRCRCDGADHRRARHERSVEAHSEPPAELVGIADRPPDSIQRCLQQDFLLDPI